MTTKTLLYGIARWAPARLPAKARGVLERASAAVAARGGAAGSLVFTSAVIGVPPFYGVSLAAGALHMRLRSFLVGGALGRIVRFGAIAWGARYIGEGMLR
jgi:membrane protein YqaA with SNARE-associated domain